MVQVGEAGSTGENGRDGYWVPVAIHPHTDADFRGCVQASDDGVEPRPLFIGIISHAPKSVHVAVRVQLAERVWIIVAGSHDGDAGSLLDRPVQLHPVAMVQEPVESLIQVAIWSASATRVCKRRSQQFGWDSRDF